MKTIFTVLLLLFCIAGFSQNEFFENFDSNTKQTVLITYEKVDNPTFQKGLLLVVDTIIQVHTTESSGQFYYLRDTTKSRYERKYLGWQTNHKFEQTTVFRNREASQFWVWSVNDKGELVKAVAPDFLFK